MNKKLKLAMAMGTVATIAAPLATLACGTKVSYMSLETLNVGLVTDAGDIDDKSFNEQGYDALKTIRNITHDDAAKSFYNKPSTHSAADIAKGYQALKEQNVILAPGFYHVDAINQYHKNVKSNRKNFILVDGEIKESNVASVIFDTRYAAFQAGYLAAKYLEAKSDDTPTLGTFGGGNFSGVTDFMVGFVYGAKYYNDTRAVGKNAVAFAKIDKDEDYTNSGFEAGKGATYAQKLIGDKADKAGNADIILPVAGPQTSDVMTTIGDPNHRIKVIGVDVNQADVYGSGSDVAKKKHFITSIEKQVKTAFVDIIKDKANFGKTITGGLEKKWVGISNNTSNGYGWGSDESEPSDKIAGAAAIYKAVSDLTKTQIDEAISGFASKTWANALVELKAMNNNTPKAAATK